jgi:AcrR family transcriptional regulator
MPRITPAHEQAVRTRIIESALRVFAEKGYHGATIADVVRDSQLSVGAIYTYYRGKDELFIATCELSAGQGLGELATRLVRGRTAAEKMAIAIGFFLDSMVGGPGQPDMAAALVMQWSRAEAEPALRASLTRRRDQVTTVGELLIREGMATGELPAWVDAPALAAAFVSFLDGLLLWRLEAGDAFRREDAERRARALLGPVLASAAAPEPPQVPAVASAPWSLLGPAPEGAPGRRPATR